jgi:hypothetical protein
MKPQELTNLRSLHKYIKDGTTKSDEVTEQPVFNTILKKVEQLFPELVTQQ